MQYTGFKNEFHSVDGRIHLYNGDNMELMKQTPDGYFDISICDPPYGLDFGKFNRTNKDSNGIRYKANRYHHGDWDSGIPTDEYFDELFRVSKNIICWGGNYFPYLWKNGCRGFIFWYKKNPAPNFSDGELAWTSFDTVAKCCEYMYFGNINSEQERIHSTQKPVYLYSWLLANYAKEGDKILDTHAGSFSSGIACHKNKFEMTATEISEEFFAASVKRFKNHESQITMF